LNFPVILVYFTLGDNQKQKTMQKTPIGLEKPWNIHGENAAEFLKAIKENNHAEIELYKRQFCTSLLEDAKRRTTPPAHGVFIVLPPQEEPEYLKVFIKIAQKLMLEKNMSLESVVEILCTDKDFVQWLIQKAKEIVNYVVKKVSGGKYSPFEDDVLLGSIDLRSHADGITKNSAVVKDEHTTWGSVAASKKSSSTPGHTLD
jgi:hypothetical protein